MRHGKAQVEIRTEACLVDPCRFAMIARVLIRDDQQASWNLSACDRLPRTRINWEVCSCKVGVGVDFHHSRREPRSSSGLNRSATFTL